MSAATMPPEADRAERRYYVGYSGHGSVYRWEQGEVWTWDEACAMADAWVGYADTIGGGAAIRDARGPGEWGGRVFSPYVWRAMPPERLRAILEQHWAPYREARDVYGRDYLNGHGEPASGAAQDPHLTQPGAPA